MSNPGIVPRPRLPRLHPLVPAGIPIIVFTCHPQRPLLNLLPPLLPRLGLSWTSSSHLPLLNQARLAEPLTPMSCHRHMRRSHCPGRIRRERSARQSWTRRPRRRYRDTTPSTPIGPHQSSKRRSADTTPSRHRSRWPTRHSTILHPIRLRTRCHRTNGMLRARQKRPHGIFAGLLMTRQLVHLYAHPCLMPPRLRLCTFRSRQIRNCRTCIITQVSCKPSNSLWLAGSVCYRRT